MKIYTPLLILLLFTFTPLVSAQTPSESSATLLLQDEATFVDQKGPGWKAVAPGTWEQRRDDGSRLRVGFGLESFELELQDIRAERQQILKMARQDGHLDSVEKQIHELDAQIEYLEQTVAQARLTAPSKLGQSGNSCGGFFSLTANASNGWNIVNGDSRAVWMTAGPPNPFDKELSVYAMAYSDSGGFDNDSNHVSFRGGCCYNLQVDAEVLHAPGSECFASSRAFLVVTGDCQDFRVVSESSRCPIF